MPAVLVTGYAVMQDSLGILPYCDGRSHNQYSFLPTHRGSAQAESTWVLGSVPRWFTLPKTVTHPGTNRAQRRVTTLIVIHIFTAKERLARRLNAVLLTIPARA